MLMVYMKARPMHSNGADALDSSKGRAWIGLVNELQQNLRVVSKTLANYAIASQALRGMKGIASSSPGLCFESRGFVANGKCR